MNERDTIVLDNDGGGLVQMAAKFNRVPGLGGSLAGWDGYSVQGAANDPDDAPVNEPGRSTWLGMLIVVLTCALTVWLIWSVVASIVN